MIRVSHAFIFNQILTKYSSERNTYSLYDYTYEILLYLILLLNKKKRYKDMLFETQFHESRTLNLIVL